MFFAALTRPQAHPERAFDRCRRECPHAREKMIDHDIRKAALKHFMGCKSIGRIFPDNLLPAEQIGDMAKPLALWRRFGPPRLTDLTGLSGIHAWLRHLSLNI
jgi:hypothetical protein